MRPGPAYCINKFLNTIVACFFCVAIYAQEKPANLYYKVVAQDGTGQYATIQAAINDCKSFPPERITIFVKNGRYHEKVKVHEWNPDITLIVKAARELL